MSAGKSIAQVSLRWLLQKPVVSSVIIGATKLQQLDDNMGAANGWELTPEEVSAHDSSWRSPWRSFQLIFDENRKISVMNGTVLFVFRSCELHFERIEEMYNPHSSRQCCSRCSAVMMSALHGHISDSPTLNLLYMCALSLLCSVLNLNKITCSCPVLN